MKKLKYNDIQFKIIFLVLMVFFFTLSITIVFCFQFVKEEMNKQIEEFGIALTEEIAHEVKISSLASTSMVRIQEIMDKIAKKENIAYAMVIDKNLKAIAHSHKDRIGIVLNDEGSKKAAIDGCIYVKQYEYKGQEMVYDVLVPLTVNKKNIGAVNLGIWKTDLNNRLKEMLIKFIMIGLGALFIGGGTVIILIKKIILPLKPILEAESKA